MYFSLPSNFDFRGFGRIFISMLGFTVVKTNKQKMLTEEACIKTKL